MESPNSTHTLHEVKIIKKMKFMRKNILQKSLLESILESTRLNHAINNIFSYLQILSDAHNTVIFVSFVKLGQVPSLKEAEV